MVQRVRVVVEYDGWDGKVLAADIIGFLEKGYRILETEIDDENKRYIVIVEPRIEDVGDSCE